MKETFKDYNNSPKVYIIIINYKGYSDTIECLESIIGNRYENYRIIVVDNYSENDSLKFIKLWADSKKESVNCIFFNESIINSEKSAVAKDARLILLQANGNGGFAAGNNLGIKYALSENDFDYIWLLNNDTVIEKDSLSKLVGKVLDDKNNGFKIGITGSKLLFYDNRDIIQGVGGKYNKWIGSSKHIGGFEKDAGQYDNNKVKDKINYIIGASMFVSKEFIENTGLMCEDYFVYFEDLDWIVRGKRKGWSIGYCWESRIYHKFGATIGSSENKKEKSEISDYYALRNRILFTKKFYPYCLPTVYAGFIAVIFNRIARKQFKRLKMIFSILKSI